MADKQQTIRVKFVTDTSGLHVAQKAAQQAQAATDQLRNSSVKAGADSAKAFKATQTSIDDMRIRLATLKITMDTLPLTATQRLAKYSAEYKALDAEIKRVTKSLYEQDKASKAVGNSTANTAKQFGQLFTAVKLFLTAGLVRETVSVALEMAKLSGNVEGVKRAFQRSFPESQLLLSDLQRATHGTVTEFELMQRTLQATNLGVAVESLPVLFEFAAARAQQTGESVDYLVDSIVRGIGRKSILVLDNLGLSATRLREQFNGASLASQSVADVTRGVAEIAKVELAKMGGYVETAATKVDQLAVSWKTLGKEISEIATQDGGFIEFMKSYVDSFKLLFEAVNKNISVQELAAQKMRAHNAEFSANLFFQTAFTKNKEENIKVLDDEIQRLTRSVGAWAALRDEMESQNKEDQINLDIKRKSFPVKNDEIIILAQDIAFRKRLIEVKREETLEDQEVLKLLLLRLAALKEVEKVAEALGLIAAKEAEISDISDKIKAAKSTREIHDLNNELAILNGELADLKAFGTTKQFLQVDGALKLVPVIAPKNSSKTLTETPKQEMTDQLEADIKELIARIPTGSLTITLPVTITPESEWDKLKDAFAERQGEFTDIALNATADILIAQYQMEVSALDARIKATRDFYDEQNILAGNNEKFKSELRLKEEREMQRLTRLRAERERKAALGGILVNTALGIIKALATATTIYDGIAQAALVAGEGIAQYAAASRARYYAKGKVNIDGPGTGTSDSIRANISKGESVIAATPTKRSLKLLEGINAGKIDDRILQKLHITQHGIRSERFDDSGIIDAIKKQQYPDIVTIGSEVYEKKKAQDGFSIMLKKKRLSK